MTEPPAPYVSRLFVCERCRRTFAPTPEEAEELAALEKIGLPADRCSALCEECAADATAGSNNA